MVAISAEQFVRVWERSRGLSPAHKALVYLAECGGHLPENTRAWSIGRRDCSLMSLYAEIFARDLELQCDCASCGTALELSLDVESLASADDAAGLSVREAMAEEGGTSFRLRLPTTGDLADVSTIPDPEAAVERLIAQCIAVDEVSGTVEACAIPADALDRLTDMIQRHDPCAHVELRMKCPGCGHDWAEVFDIVDLFGDEVDRRALQLLADVHVLASAYGWSEHAILAMPTSRREVYLELCRQ